MSSRKVFPKLDKCKTKFVDFKLVVESRVTNSMIVLKFGKLCLASKSKKGLKVIKKPIIEKRAILDHCLKFELKTTIRPAMAMRIEAK